MFKQGRTDIWGVRLTCMPRAGTSMPWGIQEGSTRQSLRGLTLSNLCSGWDLLGGPAVVTSWNCLSSMLKAPRRPYGRANYVRYN